MLNYGEESLVCDNEGIKVINRFPLENPFFFFPIRTRRKIDREDWQLNFLFLSFLVDDELRIIRKANKIGGLVEIIIIITIRSGEIVIKLGNSLAKIRRRERTKRNISDQSEKRRGN